MRVFSAIAPLACALVLVPAVAAGNEPEVDVATNGSRFAVEGIDRSSASTDHRSIGGAEPERLLYAPACQMGGQAVCDSTRVCNGSGVLHFVFALTVAAEQEYRGQVCLGGDVPTQTAPPEVTSAMVLRALRRVAVPEPELVVQPPGGKTLVNLETIFSTTAEPFTTTVRILGRRVELRITPQTYLWAHGDGTTQRSTTPGRAYQRGVAMQRYLTHVYTDADVTVRPRVTVEYGATYRVDNGPWRTVDGTVNITGPTQPLRVVEATPVLVTPR